MAQFLPKNERGSQLKWVNSEHISHTQSTYNGNKLLFIKTIHHAFGVRSTKRPKIQLEWYRTNFTEGHKSTRYNDQIDQRHKDYTFSIYNFDFFFFRFSYSIQIRKTTHCSMLFQSAIHIAYTLCAVCTEIIICNNNFFSLFFSFFHSRVFVLYLSVIKDKKTPEQPKLSQTTMCISVPNGKYSDILYINLIYKTFFFFFFFFSLLQIFYYYWLNIKHWAYSMRDIVIPVLNSIKPAKMRFSSINKW